MSDDLIEAFPELDKSLPHRYHVVLFHQDWASPKYHSFESQEDVADWIGELGDRSEEFLSGLDVMAFYGKQIPVRFTKKALVVLVNEEKYLVEKKE